MNKELITSLALLKNGSVIIGISKKGDEHIFVANSLQHDNEANTSYLELIEINENFTTWKMTVPTGCNKEGRFLSKNDSSFDFKFFNTGKNCEELSDVLVKHLKSE